jgi:23S rRNA G2445 N2-methylase RlmL
LGHAKENAGRARVRVAWLHTDVDALELPAGPGLIATNPPWGGRLGGDVEGAYHRLARLLERSPGWRMIFLCPDASRARLVSKRATRLTSFRAGTIEVGMWAIDR